LERAAIYIATYPSVLTLPSDDLRGLSAEQAERLRTPVPALPFDVQERACRAYCERMGYSIFGVYRADKPPPEDGKGRFVLQISSNPMRWLYEYDSRHPYYWVRNLLASGTIDLIVTFRVRGPSGNIWADMDDAENRATSMPREEAASLWEIEPPTDIDLRIYELGRAIENADTKEEQAPLLAELKALFSQRKRAAEQPEPQAAQPPSDIGQAVKEMHKAQRGMASAERALAAVRKHAPALGARLMPMEARLEALRQEVARVATEAETQLALE
jgi:hypothetical protein